MDGLAPPDGSVAEEDPALKRERDEFFERLAAYNQQYDVTLNRAPIMGGHKLNLHELFKAVTKLQGFEKVQEQKKWRELAHHLGVPRTCTSATAQLRSNYLKYLYAYECWILGKEKLDRAQLAERLKGLANKAELRTLGLLEGDGVAGTGAGGAGGAPGSPSEGMVGALKKAVSPPVKQSGVAMLSWQQQPAGSHVGPLAGAHVMGAATMGVAQGANQPALAVGGMHGSYAGYASFAREPVVPGGLPASATSSYPSALPVKPMTNKSHGETSADPHAGGRLQVQLEPHAAGYWFRQKKFWADLDDATPSQAKSTYPQDVVRDLYETSAVRFARSIELGVEPDLTYVLSALSVLSADREVPLWDPFATNNTKAASELIFSICKAVSDCARMNKLLSNAAYTSSRGKPSIEAARGDSLFEDLSATTLLSKQGDAMANVVEKAVTLLGILNNFVGGHPRIARAIAAETKAVMQLLAVASQESDISVIRAQVIRILNQLEPHLSADRKSRTIAQCIEVYSFLLGQRGNFISLDALAETLKGMYQLALRKESGLVLHRLLLKYKVLEWMDAYGILHQSALIRSWTLRALEAISDLRHTSARPKRETASSQLSAHADAEEEGGGAGGDHPAGNSSKPSHGVSDIAAQVAKMSNLSGVVVMASVQDENWGLRLRATRVLASLCSIDDGPMPLGESEGEFGDTLGPEEQAGVGAAGVAVKTEGGGEAGADGEEKKEVVDGDKGEVKQQGGGEEWAFVASIAGQKELLTEVLLSGNVSDETAKYMARVLRSIGKWQKLNQLQHKKRRKDQSQARLEGQGVLVSTEDISQQKRQRLQREDVEVQEAQAWIDGGKKEPQLPSLAPTAVGPDAGGFQGATDQQTGEAPIDVHDIELDDFENFGFDDDQKKGDLDF